MNYSMSYNHYLDFLKSFKAFIAGVFPEIEHYQFNYADKAFLNYKLYEEHVKEYPMCIINLTDITTDDNKAFFRYIGNTHPEGISQVLTSNHTRHESVVMDFKWVTIQMDIKINLYGTADLLNYHNQLISAFPKGFMFYAYEYQALINVDKYATDWDVSDDTENLHYRTHSSEVQKFAAFSNEPLFRMNSIVKNKVVDGDTSLDINLEVRLQVPNVVGTTTKNNKIVNGIQIVMNTNTSDGDLPILIDMDNDIYSDRRRKLTRSYILSEDNFDTENNTVSIDSDVFAELENKSISIYMVDDSTKQDPVINWTEIPLVSTDHHNDDSTKLVFELVDDISSFNFSQLSNCSLYVFG